MNIFVLADLGVPRGQVTAAKVFNLRRRLQLREVHRNTRSVLR